MVDIDKNGVIDRDEFVEIMKLPDITRTFKDVEIPCVDPHMLFEIFGEVLEQPSTDDPTSPAVSEIREQNVKATRDVEGLKDAQQYHSGNSESSGASVTPKSHISRSKTCRGSLASVDVSSGQAAESYQWKGFNVEEFIHAALQLRGEPKGYDLRKTCVEIRTILRRISTIEERAGLLPLLLHQASTTHPKSNNGDMPSSRLQKPKGSSYEHSAHADLPTELALAKRLDD